MLDNILTDKEISTEMWLYKTMLGITWTEHLRSDEVLEKNRKKGRLYLTSKRDKLNAR